MNEKIFKAIRQLEAYTPGERPAVKNPIKLNTNENPYPPSPKVADAQRNITANQLVLYPDSESNELTEELARYYNVEKKQVFVGNGSDDCLGLIFLTFFNSDQPVLFPDITYSFYKVWCGLYNISYKAIPLDENFNLREEDYETANSGVVIANPNAPTGIYRGLSFIENILEKNKESIVVVDEAYIDFGGESAIKLVNKYDNLLVVHTFSKYRALAGIRLAYVIGNENLIKYLNAAKNSYNSYPVNYVAQVLGIAALNDKDYYMSTANKIAASRDKFVLELNSMGFKTLESKANFVFTTHENRNAADILAALKQKNIYVRHFNLPRISNFLRISIGTDENMDIVCNELKEILQ